MNIRLRSIMSVFVQTILKYYNSLPGICTQSYYFVSTISELPRRLPTGQAFIVHHRIRRVVGAERLGAECATNQWTATFCEMSRWNYTPKGRPTLDLAYGLRVCRFAGLRCCGCEFCGCECGFAEWRVIS